MIKLGIVSPCYNEQDVLEESAKKLGCVLLDLWQKGKITSDSFVMYVNDGSKDDSWHIIEQLHNKHKYINGLNLAHNVGHQNALMAGMMNTKDLCDGVITIDCDLQDDINCIEKMIDLFAEGNDIVYGVKKSRKADSFMKKITAQMFYTLQSSMGVHAIYNHADFRFMSLRALNALSQFPERNLYLRGMIPLLGFKTAMVDDVISNRIAGKSKYSLSKMLRLASDGITSFTSKPMTFVFGAGIFMLIVAFLMAIYVIISLIMVHYVDGWSSIMLSIWFIGAVVTIGIGIIGTYIGKMYMEVKHRPLYIVADKLVHNL